MDESNKKVKEYVRRLMLSRMALLCNSGFYGLLLMHVKMALSDKHENTWNDGKCIYFNPQFLDELSDSELEYVLCHEIMHIVLKHTERMDSEWNQEQSNIAADIIVNSNILRANGGDEKSITLSKYGVGMHLAPNGEEGYKYSLEELYEILVKSKAKADDQKTSKQKGDNDATQPSKQKGDRKGQNPQGFDFHGNSSEDGNEDEDYEHQKWTDYIKAAAENVEKRSILKGSNKCGDVPLCAERLLDELKKPQTDWRTVLNEFIQEEITDYSFAPPDRRFDDSPFFLPDYNEKDYIARDILFFIDTSGSMSDEMINQAYSEIKGAIDQFEGKLTGWLGFFDAIVVPPVRFEDEDEFKLIRPKGGGGTRFDIIFRYVQEKMDEPPASIIILTDGYAPFPKEKEAMDIPVLWLINNDKVNPPWGRVTRMEIDCT